MKNFCESLKDHAMKIINFRKKKINLVTLIWVGFLGVHFEMVGGDGKITSPPTPPRPPCLKLMSKIRIMTGT